MLLYDDFVYTYHKASQIYNQWAVSDQFGFSCTKFDHFPLPPLNQEAANAPQTPVLYMEVTHSYIWIKIEKTFEMWTQRKFIGVLDG